MNKKPKNGVTNKMILGDFGYPWLLPAMWSNVNQQWVVATIQSQKCEGEMTLILKMNGSMIRSLLNGQNFQTKLEDIIMKFLWFLLPFAVFWLAFYILGQMYEAGFQWWSFPLGVTMFLIWGASVVYAGDKVDKKP